MEEMVFNLADTHFFFNDVEVCNILRCLSVVVCLLAEFDAIMGYDKAHRHIKSKKWFVTGGHLTTFWSS
jgi:hypothetical protein